MFSVIMKLCSFILEKFIDYYEKGVSKVSWNLITVSYIVYENWFAGEDISSYNILVTQNNHKISLDREKIFDDFFSKLSFNI